MNKVNVCESDVDQRCSNFLYSSNWLQWLAVVTLVEQATYFPMFEGSIPAATGIRGEKNSGKNKNFELVSKLSSVGVIFTKTTKSFTFNKT